MDRFDDLLSDYMDGVLDAAGRAELGAVIESDPARLDAFLDAVSGQRIRRIAMERA
ncbi:MAG TPA: hypothetical protein VE981_09550 [Planctomycetota bacterium]|nr:hypothetical protein [Planctomycetota bacterium]